MINRSHINRLTPPWILIEILTGPHCARDRLQSGGRVRAPLFHPLVIIPSLIEVNCDAAETTIERKNAGVIIPRGSKYHLKRDFQREAQLF